MTAEGGRNRTTSPGERVRIMLERDLVVDEAVARMIVNRRAGNNGRRPNKPRADNARRG